MNLLKTLLPIAAGIGAGYFLGGGTAAGIDTARLATSFLTATGGGQGNPFQKSQQAGLKLRPRRPEELTSGSKASIRMPSSLQPIQQLVSNSPRLETAMTNLYNNASNQQVREMFSQYSQDMPSTLRQGRRTLTTEQPGNIQVDVA